MDKAYSFLLVDDDEDDALLFREVLEQVNPSILFQSANNGEVALERLKSRSSLLPDIIFLDLNMPRVDGKQCLREIKCDNTLKHLPVIVYSTSSYTKDIDDMLHNGAFCFIKKPSQLKDLKNILTAISTGLPTHVKDQLQSLSSQSDVLIMWEEHR